MKKAVKAFLTDVKDFKNLAPQVRFLLLIQVIILFILSLLIGIVFSPKFRSSIITQMSPQEKDLKESARKKTTSYFFSPADTIMKEGEERDIALKLSGPYPTVTDIILEYDPLYISVIKMTKGDVFGQEIQKEIQKNKVLYSAALLPDQDPTLQGDVIVILTVKALKRTEGTEIIFQDDKTIAAYEGDNILKSAEPMVIRIFDEP